MPKRTNVQKLQRKAETLWKKIALKRDGKACQVQIHYPYINITHSDTYQVDHCFTRRNKHLFLDPRNSTVICSSCNRAKGFNQKSIDEAVKNIVRKREGESVYAQMLHNNMTCSANENWSRVWWLTEQVEKLQGILDEMA